MPGNAGSTHAGRPQRRGTPTPKFTPEAMVYVLAVATALSNALTSVFQRMGVEDAPEDATMRLSLMAHALRRGVWLFGFCFMVCSFLLQAVALHLGILTVVQPILTMELLFLVAILGTYFRFTISVREWVGAAAIALGLAGFLFFAAPAAATRCLARRRGWRSWWRSRGSSQPQWWRPGGGHVGGGPPCSERPLPSPSPSPRL